ncbi:MAG: hypothetical protein ACREKN_04020 [Longimicrobiaceae bacterium]
MENGGDTVEHALNAFRERRRRRRSDDTWYGDGAGTFPAGLSAKERERRRSELMDDAEEAGMPLALAEALYDVAREEGLDPDLGFELVRGGLAVQPPDGGVVNAPAHPTVDRYRPEWLEPPAPTDELLRERALRLSFRRFASLVRERGSVEKALRAFAAEPDVDFYGY